MSGTPTNTAEKLKQGMSFHQAGQLSEAATIYKSILSDEPNNVDALNLLGVIFHTVGQSEAAIPLLIQAAQTAPDYFAPFVNLGNALQATGELERAAIAFRKALELNPDATGVTQNNLASVLNELGQHQEALTSAEAAFAIMQDKTNARLNLGNALFGLGRTDEAELRFREIVALNPNFGNAWQILGEILDQVGGKDEEAQQCFARAKALGDF